MEVQVLPDRERAVQGVLLGDHADQLLGAGRVGDDVDARDMRLAGGRDDPGGEHAGRGRLSGPVRSEQAEDLTGVHD